MRIPVRLLMTLDHPFIFILRDQTNMIFMGRHQMP